MNEGGQSSTGQLIDFVIKSHAAYPKLLEASEKQKKNIFTCEHGHTFREVALICLQYFTISSKRFECMMESKHSLK